MGKVTTASWHITYGIKGISEDEQDCFRCSRCALADGVSCMSSGPQRDDAEHTTEKGEERRLTQGKHRNGLILQILHTSTMS